MSHESQRYFVRLISENMSEFFNDCKVLEVGSLDINGSVRDCFTNCEYIGLDVAEGKHVDVVCQGQDYSAPDNYFDQVISCEAMEHNPYWVETFENMIRMCRPGGLVVMTCASTGRAEHGTSRTRPRDSPLSINVGWDYYLNLTEKHFIKRIRLQDEFVYFKFWTNWNSYDLFFCGIKKTPKITFDTEMRWNSTKNAVDEYLSSANSFKFCRYRKFFAKLFGDKWFIKMRALENMLAYLNGR
jgi:SAM-dependent methyltransferase